MFVHVSFFGPCKSIRFILTLNVLRKVIKKTRPLVSTVLETIIESVSF